MRFFINLLTTLQCIALGNVIGKIVGNIIVIYAMSNPNGLTSWFSGVYETGLQNFALIGIFAMVKGILRFIEDRI